MVYRIFVEKKPGLDHEAKKLLADIKGLLQIEAVTDVRIAQSNKMQINKSPLFLFFTLYSWFLESCHRQKFPSVSFDRTFQSHYMTYPWIIIALTNFFLYFTWHEDFFIQFFYFFFNACHAEKPLSYDNLLYTINVDNSIINFSIS